jgi:hypothetical protein
MSSMTALFQAVLRPFAKNANTGNLYEIVVALGLLRRMGLTDADLDANADLCSAIAAYNSTKSEKITNAFTAIRSVPVGCGHVFDGRRIVGLKNVTQDYGEGRTGDLMLITECGKSQSVSIEAGKAKRSGVIEKCLSNPSAYRYGCTPEDISAIKVIGAATIEPYKAEMTSKYGADESAWARKPSTAAMDACSRVASFTASRFASLSSKAQTAIFNDLLRIEGGSKPADYLALVHPDKLTVGYYEYSTCRISSWSPRIVAEGIYLSLYANVDHKIGSTQVKFNNGVWHKGKTSSLYSSWNATFNLTDLFTMRSVVLA